MPSQVASALLPVGSSVRRATDDKGIFSPRIACDWLAVCPLQHPGTRHGCIGDFSRVPPVRSFI